MKTFEELKTLIDRRGVHTVFGEPGEGWFIEQNSEELARFLVVCQEHGVQSVLEIGTGWKGGLSRFLVAEMGWDVTTVDIEDYGHSYAGVKYQIVERDSYPNGYGYKFDLVLIDADHTYEGVQHDYKGYAKYATKIIAFHDIAGLRECEGVRDFWNEIAYYNASINDTPEPELKHGYHEIIADGDQRGGIGYIILSEVVSAKVEPEKAIQKPAAKKPVPAKKPTARKSTAKKATGKK